MCETMKWHCIVCHADFQGPMDRTPENGCEQCGSKRIFDCNAELVGEVIPDPLVPSQWTLVKSAKLDAVATTGVKQQ